MHLFELNFPGLNVLLHFVYYISSVCLPPSLQHSVLTLSSLQLVHLCSDSAVTLQHSDNLHFTYVFLQSCNPAFYSLHCVFTLQYMTGLP
jgi:hypothetical protein